MRNWIIAILLVGLIATPVIGQQVVPVGIQANDGLYVLQIAGGQVTGLTPLPIISPNGPAPVIPVDPVVPSDLTERGKAIQAAALLATGDPNRDATAMNMGAAFDELGKRIKSGDIKDRELIALAVKLTISGLLRGKTTAETESWQPMRTELGNQFDAVAQAGGGDLDYAKCLGEAADGLRASAPNAPMEIDIAMIMMIINLILEILKNLPF